jgi:phenylacetate-CoA ligase
MAEPARSTWLRAEQALFDLAIPVVYGITGKPQMRLFRELRARDAWSPERLEEFQSAALQRLIAHAYAYVPYYRELFDSLGAQPGDIRRAEDLALLPPLTKDIVRERLHDLCVEPSAGITLLPNTTGGSTGVPLRFFQTRAFRDVSSAAWFRNYCWTGSALGARKFYVWGHPSETNAARRLKGRFEHWLHRRLFFDAFDVSAANCRDWARAIDAHGATFGYGYASALEAVATFLRDQGTTIPGVRAVMSTAERLYPHQRELIGSVFDCPVFDQYGCRESWAVASECRAGRLHVNADLHVVEFLPAEGPGKLLALTTLFNYGMPLIRYVNEDLSHPVTGLCDCGMPYPVMESVQGRVSDNFRTADGRVIHGEYLTHLMYGADGVDRFQFVQHGLTEVRLSIVRGRSFDEASRRKVDSLAAEFLAYFGFPLDVVYVDTIAPTASGKQRFTVSLL